MPCEPGPVIHFDKQVGNFDERNQRVDLPHEQCRFIRHLVFERSNFENAVSDGSIGERVVTINGTGSRNNGDLGAISGSIPVERTVFRRPSGLEGENLSHTNRYSLEP